MVYTRPQRLLALGYGLCTHLFFGLGVAAMAASLYTGMRHGLGRVPGHWAWAANLMLLAQFPLLHSFLLARRGRRLLGLLAPPSLRRELSSTVFALVSSLQLLVCFLAWTPAPSFVWSPEQPVFAVLTVTYVASWALLAQSMREAGLGLHLGSLGWRAVWNQRPVRYPGVPDGALHSQVRQPIYIAFTLILWTAPVWSIDRMLFTFGWTIYCVMGALLKERRHERILGAAYAAYQRRVPFWFPRLRRRAVHAPAAPVTDVVIVGAGPVGLLLANLLAREGLSVALIETRREPRHQSMAIGITPPSLDILETLGLAESFLRAGVCIRRAFVHETGHVAGALTFEEADPARPFILSLPQLETERLLAGRLATEPRVAVHRGWSVEGVEQDRDGVRVTASESNTGRECAFSARFAVGCDGAHSAVRELARFRVRRKAYAPSFTMADYVDTTGLGATAHLFFGAERPVESFPLPGGLRRWIIRTGWREETDLVEPLETSIARLAGFVVPPAACVWRSGFRPRRHEATRFYRGRVVLCGDAAHGMSPIGGQGMNVGFGDATHLACALAGIIRYAGNPRALLAGYDRARRHAFRRAAARAAIGMALGTWTGHARSRLRAAIVAVLLDHAPTHRAAARWFTMRSLPEPVVLKAINA